MTMNVDEEIEKLKVEIARLGKDQPDGSICVKFGTLFNDDRCANIFEALVGTLRAAKKRKLLKFDGELLLQGVHDNVDVILLSPSSKKPDSKPDGIRSKPALSAGKLTSLPAKATLAPIKVALTPSKPAVKVSSG